MSSEKKTFKSNYDETFEMYRELLSRQRPLKGGEDEDRIQKIILKNTHHTLYKIEEFVIDIANGNAMRFRDLDYNPSADEAVMPGSLYHNFRNIKPFLLLYSKNYSYSPYVQVFFDACMHMEIMAEPFNNPTQRSPKSDNSPPGIPLFQSAVYDDLIFSIEHRLHTDYDKIQRQLDFENRIAEEQFDNAVKYVDACFKACPELLVLRMDLWGLAPQPNSLNTKPFNIRRLQQYFSELRLRLNFDDPFLDVVGYLGKYEYGEIKGHFINLVILIDNRESKPESYWLKLIGECWQKIAKGGQYYDCHQEVDPNFPEKGLGVIALNSKQTQKRSALGHWTISYLTKSSKYLRAKGTNRKNLFFKGRRPKKRITANVIAGLLAVIKDKKAQNRLKEVQAIYEDMALNRNNSSSHPNTMFNPYSKASLSSLLQIERLVTAIAHDARGAFDVYYDDDDKQSEVENPIGAFLSQLGNLENLETTIEKSKSTFSLEFSIYVDLFCEAIRDFVHDTRARNAAPLPRRGPTPEREIRESIDSYNDVVDRIRKKLIDPKNKDRINKQNSRENAKSNSAQKYVNSLFDRNGDLYIVALNLYTHPFTTRGTPPQLLTQFLKTCRQQKGLSGIVGFMGKWEYTAHRGLYLQLILFIKATTVPRTQITHLPKNIGQYWVGKIIANEGSYTESAITYDFSFINNTVFQIQRGNKALRKIFKERVIAYFTKSDLYVKENKMPLTYVFTRGELPMKKKRKAKETL